MVPMSLSMLGLQKTSLIDYPGLVSAVVFTHGCNMSCGYCHNGVLVRGPRPEDFLPREEVLDILRARRHLIRGVVITGGEPLLHDDLPDLIDEIKSLGLRVKVDTNGSLPERLRNIAPDYIAMDYKLPVSRYQLYHLENPEVLLKSIQYIRQSPIPHEFRLVWVPRVNALDDIPVMAAELGTGAPLFVTAFRPVNTLDPSFGLFGAPRPQELQGVVNLFRSYGVDAHLRI